MGRLFGMGGEEMSEGKELFDKLKAKTAEFKDANHAAFDCGVYCGSVDVKNGEVTVTTNEAGDCVAVTRQDKDGKILSVIWERNN